VIANFGAGWLLAGMLALFIGALAAGLLYFGRCPVAAAAAEPVTAAP
jgi:ESS family glutamate:Na+ symporter